MAAEARALVERVFREESGQAVATLIRVLGDFDLAEEAVQEAFLVAAQRWPTAGVPDRPGAWIITTARNKAIDRLRRERGLAERRATLALLEAARGQDPGRAWRLDRGPPDPGDGHAVLSDPER